MRIGSMDQLDRLTALTTLSVAHNCLTRFDWKGGCANLTELNISRNKVRNGQVIRDPLYC
jgi:Leucine-rich repeat (LRR) protein